MTYTEGRKRANSKWDHANLNCVSIALPTDTKVKIMVTAKVSGDSFNGWVRHVILGRLNIMEGRELEQD